MFNTKKRIVSNTNKLGRSTFALTHEEARNRIRPYRLPDRLVMIVDGTPVDPINFAAYGTISDVRSSDETMDSHEQLYAVYACRSVLRGEDIRVAAPMNYEMPVAGLDWECTSLTVQEADAWCTVSLLWCKAGIDYPLNVVAADVYSLKERKTRNLNRLIRDMTVEDVIGLSFKPTNNGTLRALGATGGTGITNDHRVPPFARAMVAAQTYTERSTMEWHDALGTVLTLHGEMQCRNLPVELLPVLTKLYADHDLFSRSKWFPHFKAFADLRAEAKDIPDELLFPLVEKELKADD